MSVLEIGDPEPVRTAKRGFITDEVAQPTIRVAPRRALVVSSEVPDTKPAIVAARQQGPRRMAPVRALLSRFLLGREGGARRAIVDPDELLVAELIRLTGLDPRWGFMQSARQNDGITELDHWAIGPGGVYLLSAKHLPGSKLLVSGDQFLVDGHELGFVPEMRGVARTNTRTMSSIAHVDLLVNGVIVPFHDRRLTIRRSPRDVSIVDEIDVANWLVNRPENMGKRQILSAFSAARENCLSMPRFIV